MINDIEAKKLKEDLLPVMIGKVKDYKKAKYIEWSRLDDDDNDVELDKANDLYIENKEMGTKFDKRLVEKTYQKI